MTSCYGMYTVVGVNIKREMVLSPNDEEVANSSKNIPNSRLECTNHTLFQTKMVEIDTLFQTKTAKKTILFGAAHTYIAYVRDYPPPGVKNAWQIMSLAAYASQTNNFHIRAMYIVFDSNYHICTVYTVFDNNYHIRRSRTPSLKMDG